MGLISNGTTLLDAGAISAAKGALTLIKTVTASSSATISFVHGTSDVVLDSTYPIYLFKFYDIHPSADGEDLGFQANASGGSGYNETITSTAFRTFHNEDDSGTGLGYRAAEDQAQGTGFQDLIHQAASDNDQNACGTLHLFSPSSTVFVKHFFFTGNHVGPTDFSREWFIAGYINTTSAITEIQFKMSSGNIDSGTIKLYGVT